MTRPTGVVACAVLVLLSALAAGCRAGLEDAPADDPSLGGRVIPPDDTTGDDGLTITFGSVPAPPASGDNTFIATVERSDGTPLTDAVVTVVLSMPAMPAMNMPAMQSEATLQHEGSGRYRGPGQLSMGGTWNVALTVARDSTTLGTRRFSIVARD